MEKRPGYQPSTRVPVVCPDALSVEHVKAIEAASPVLSSIIIRGDNERSLPRSPASATGAFLSQTVLLEQTTVRMCLETFESPGWQA